MKIILLVIATALSFNACAQDTVSTKQPAGEKIYYFAFPANYVDALYNTIGVSAENNKSGISILELKQMLAYQANNQPKPKVAVVDSGIGKNKKKPTKK